MPSAAASASSSASTARSRSVQSRSATSTSSAAWSRLGVHRRGQCGQELAGPVVGAEHREDDAVELGGDPQPGPENPDERPDLSRNDYTPCTQVALPDLQPEVGQGGADDLDVDRIGAVPLGEQVSSESARTRGELVRD